MAHNFSPRTNQQADASGIQLRIVVDPVPESVDPGGLLRSLARLLIEAAKRKREAATQAPWQGGAHQ